MKAKSDHGCTDIRILLPEIRAAAAKGRAQRGIAEHFGFGGSEAVEGLLKRERRREQKTVLPPTFEREPYMHF